MSHTGGLIVFDLFNDVLSSSVIVSIMIFEVAIIHLKSLIVQSI